MQGRALARGRFTPSAHQHVLRLLSRLPVALAPLRVSPLEFWNWSQSLALTPYDAAYLKVAVDLKAPLVTMDRALQRACLQLEHPDHRPGLTHATRQDPHPRLRFPGHAADRRRVREAHVFRGPSVRRERCLGTRVRRRRAPERRDPLRQPCQRVRGDHGQGAASRVRAGRAGPGHLLRHADHGAPARGQGGKRPQARVRIRGGARAATPSCCATSPTTPRPRATACSTCGCRTATRWWKCRRVSA